MKIYGVGLSSIGIRLLPIFTEVDPLVPSRNVGSHRQPKFFVLEKKIAEHYNFKLPLICWMTYVAWHMKLQTRTFIVLGSNILYLSSRNPLERKWNVFHNRNTRKIHVAQYTRGDKMSRNNLRLSRRHLLFRFWCFWNFWPYQKEKYIF